MKVEDLQVSPWGRRTVWIGRILIGVVLFFNIQCALVFLWSPQLFAPGFELSGDVGNGMVRALGILFLMWNVPYIVAFTNPVVRRVSLYEAIAMQAIGFLGETLMLASFPPAHLAIRETVSRFMLFDGMGLLFLILAAWITFPAQSSRLESETMMVKGP